ncbi:MAG: purine-nucleoside phosphorylase [Ruminococcaceae bacterium]|nr:purine-nucleoside phosphorylase [Oscillospiraceae bacterium]
MNIMEKITAAAEYILSKTQLRPTIGLVLGSGLGDFADTLEDAVRIPYGEIPYFPISTAPGHAGNLVIGKRCGQVVAALQGRFHYYEGHSMQTLTMPIRVMAKLGVKNLVLTNAAGGANASYNPGTLMLISDHINYSFDNPLIGANLEEFGPRFPDVSDLYSRELRSVVKEKAAAAGIHLEEGVYMMFTGPNYETPAEVRMAQILGADAVGMSTAPEALVGGHCGMRILGISCITNHAAGVTDAKLDHSEVVEVAAKVHDTFQKLLELVLTVF